MLQNNMKNVGSVYMYTHFKELTHQRSSNTGKWVVHAGANLVIFGQREAEEAMASHIASQPPGSVMVLYPSKNALTVEQFLHRMTSLNKEAVPATLAYDEATLNSARGLNSSETVDILTKDSVLPLGITVVILDATWGLARSLNRRLDRLCLAALNGIEAGELEDLELQDEDDPKDLEDDVSDSRLENVLSRVTLTRAFRTDVGALRRVFGNASSLRHTFDLTKLAETESNDVNKLKQRSNTRKNHICQTGCACPTDLPENKASRAGRIDVAGLSRELAIAKPEFSSGPPELVDSLAYDETGAKKVSTLHAFCVLLEEIYCLSREHSYHQDSMDELKTTPLNADHLTRTQLKANELVKSLFFVLQTAADAYHLQLNCRKSELISDELRSRLTKKQVVLNASTPVSKREAKRQAKSTQADPVNI